jgi:hypothetical protein
MRLAPAIYAGTLFLSALLLFSVQPMFAKMVLPRLGGAPAVWSVAMVFFQTALLVGYAYAHLLTRALAPRHAALVHLALLAVAALTLPISTAASFTATPTDRIELWLFGLFAVSIGLPFIALAASAPLLQAWFAASGDAQAGNPYVLYAASNLGSFAALIGYPLLIEPLLPLRAQTLGWSVGYALLALLVTAAALVVSRAMPIRVDARTDTAGAPTAMDRMTWTALAAIPAGLVVALTAFISTDVAAAPFLWVLPLALYLLTFVAIFRERPWIPHHIVLLLIPFAVTVMAVTKFGPLQVYWVTNVFLHLLGFTILALGCHGELYRRRPAPVRLTEFYLWNSLGGVVGGAFAGLLAPNIFSSTLEYPILLAGALLVLPGMFAGGFSRFLRGAGIGLGLALIPAGLMVAGLPAPLQGTLALQIVIIILFGVMLLTRRNAPVFFSLTVLALVLAEAQSALSHLEQVRSFFGVHRVAENPERTHHFLFHGTTLHGAQRIRDSEGAIVTGAPEPLAYYFTSGAIAEALIARQNKGGVSAVAVVGLGAGSMACHRRDGETWTFYEIDPEVVRIATDPRLFKFYSACARDAMIVLGDARLTLAASKQTYDAIVLDAFASDAIPVHLLTREAMAGYVTRLAPGGVMVFHISNRHMDLAGQVGALGEAAGLVTYVKRDISADRFDADYKAGAHVVALAREPSDLGALPETEGWKPIEKDKRVRAWTDDFADVLGAIIEKKMRR